MFEDTNEGVDAFAALMDDSGNLPGDEGFKPDEAEEQSGVDEAAAALEEHVDDDVEDEDNADDEDEDGDEDSGDDTADDDSDTDSGLDPETTMVDIEIDGELYEVNLAELQAGYLRNEELVKRQTSLETEHETRIAQLEAKEAELVSELEAYTIQGISDLNQYEKINWQKLRDESPEEYQAKRLEFLDKREQLQAQIQRRNSIKAMQDQAAQIKHQAYLEKQTELITKLLPDFPKPEFQTALVKYGETIGFTEEEVRGIADARQLVVLDAARKYAESQLKKKEIISKKQTEVLPEVLKPGSKKPQADAATKRSKLARQRLQDEGTLDAATAAFLDFV